MTVSLATVKDQLPADAPTVWPKPMAAEGYKPSHPGAFHVVFSSSADGSESYSSKLVADRVSVAQRPARNGASLLAETWMSS